MKKRLTVLFLTSAMVMALSSCGNSTPTAENQNTSFEVESQVDISTSANEDQNTSSETESQEEITETISASIVNSEDYSGYDYIIGADQTKIHLNTRLSDYIYKDDESDPVPIFHAMDLAVDLGWTKRIKYGVTLYKDDEQYCTILLGTGDEEVERNYKHIPIQIGTYEERDDDDPMKEIGPKFYQTTEFNIYVESYSEGVCAYLPTAPTLSYDMPILLAYVFENSSEWLDNTDEALNASWSDSAYFNCFLNEFPSAELGHIMKMPAFTIYD